MCCFVCSEAKGSWSIRDLATFQECCDFAPWSVSIAATTHEQWVLRASAPKHLLETQGMQPAARASGSGSEDDHDDDEGADSVDSEVQAGGAKSGSGNVTELIQLDPEGRLRLTGLVYLYELTGVPMLKRHCSALGVALGSIEAMHWNIDRDVRSELTRDLIDKVPTPDRAPMHAAAKAALKGSDGRDRGQDQANPGDVQLRSPPRPPRGRTDRRDKGGRVSNTGSAAPSRSVSRGRQSASSDVSAAALADEALAQLTGIATGPADVFTKFRKLLSLIPDDPVRLKSIPHSLDATTQQLPAGEVSDREVSAAALALGVRVEATVMPLVLIKLGGKLASAEQLLRHRAAMTAQGKPSPRRPTSKAAAKSPGAAAAATSHTELNPANRTSNAASLRTPGATTRPNRVPASGASRRSTFSSASTASKAVPEVLISRASLTRWLMQQRYPKREGGLDKWLAAKRAQEQSAQKKLSDKFLNVIGGDVPARRFRSADSPQWFTEAEERTLLRQHKDDMCPSPLLDQEVQLQAKRWLSTSRGRFLAHLRFAWLEEQAAAGKDGETEGEDSIGDLNLDVSASAAAKPPTASSGGGANASDSGDGSGSGYSDDFHDDGAAGSDASKPSAASVDANDDAADSSAAKPAVAASRKGSKKDLMQKAEQFVVQKRAEELLSSPPQMEELVRGLFEAFCRDHDMNRAQDESMEQWLEQRVRHGQETSTEFRQWTAASKARPYAPKRKPSKALPSPTHGPGTGGRSAARKDATAEKLDDHDAEAEAKALKEWQTEKAAEAKARRKAEREEQAAKEVRDRAVGVTD